MAYFRCVNCKARMPLQEPIYVECDACGKEVDRSHAINYIPCIGSPGYPELKPFGLPQEELWSCSLTCWRVIAVKANAQMYQLLEQAHENRGKQNGYNHDTVRSDFAPFPRV